MNGFSKPWEIVRPMTKRIVKTAWRVRLWSDTKGQDLIEYALIAGFIAVAAGAVMPGVTTSIKSLFSKIGRVLNNQTTSIAG